MKIWPFGRVETRASGDFTEAVIAAALAAASSTAPSAATAAREIVGGWWGRAFQSAELKGDPVVSAALLPHLGLIGRALILQGQVVFRITIDDGLRLTPATVGKITGGPDVRTWRYELELIGPSSTTKVTLPAAEVLHLTFATEPESPWRGVGPLQGASSTNTLVTGLERGLGDEAGGPTGHVVPVPLGVDVQNLANDVSKLRGGVSFPPTTSSGLGQGISASPRSDWDPKRIGANPPDSVVKLRMDAAGTLLAACGVPVTAITSTDATGLRESFRQFLHLSVMPVSARVAHQISETFETDISFSFRRLMASDITSRSRSLKQMVDAGIVLPEARKLAGLELD